VIDELYEEALSKGSVALHVARERFGELTDLVPPVRAVKVGIELQPRYVEKLPEQAILLKVARQLSVVSFLNHAVEVGHVYEQGILQRIADETLDDVTFLALGVRNGLNKLHRKFLAGFWEEDFVDHGEGARFTFVPQVKRKEIRDYIGRHCRELGIDGSESASRTVYGVFSGYVHGSAAYIFELFDKTDSNFRLSGKFDQAQQLPYLLNAVNYPYRAIMSVIHADQAIEKGSASPGFFAFFKEHERWLEEYLNRATEIAGLITFPVGVRRA
jgi:hypothetical protein